MAHFSVVCVSLVFLVFSKETMAGTLNDTNTLLANLLKDYNTNVRPVENQSLPVYVSIQPYVKSIQEFDEVKEMFSFVGAIFVMWVDDRMKWDPEEYGGINEIHVSYNDVWIPEMILSSPSDDVDSLGKKWNRIRYHSYGLAQWLPVDLIKSTCSVNVKNYPFDSQSCLTSFNALGYDSREIVIMPWTNQIDVSIFQPNSLWDIQNTSVSVLQANVQLDCTFHLKRKPSFVIINILLPILCLSLLNVLVFLLVPESGERASYCITVLLSIAVFMTIVNDMLPRSSTPVPMISYKLMLDMVISSLIVFVAILNLRIYSRDNSDPVPKWLQKFYLVMSCVWCKKRTIDPGDNTLKTYIPRADGDTTKSNNGNRTKSMRSINIKAVATLGNDEKKPLPTANIAWVTDDLLERQKITWKKISFMFDWIALVFFTLASLISFSLFIIITST